MQKNQILFDPKSLMQHRQRTDGADPSAWFLHKFAAAQVSERLKEINRSFTKTAIVGWKAGLWAAELAISADLIQENETLALEQSAYDLIVNGLNLHWSNDPVGQLIQMRRALKPDGLMIAVLFVGQTLQELRQAFLAGELQVSGGVSPRVSPLAEIRSLGNLLHRAGFALPVADVVPVKTSYKSPLALMRDLQSMGETNALADRRKCMMPRSVLDAAINHYKENSQTGDNLVVATFELGFLTGWRPADNQRKPLRPGSAQAKLASFLGPEEPH